MLIRFTVKNFLSFGSEEVFSMEPGKVRGKRDHVLECRGCNLLKFAAIYGSNAAGKSNYIYAMRFARDTVLNGMPRHTMNRYHRIDPENRNRPTEFTFEIRLGKKRYRYSFALNLYNATFLKESLVDFSTAKPREIFFRDLTTGEHRIRNLSKNETSNQRVQAYLEDMEDDASILFLQEMNRNKTQAYKLIPELDIFSQIYRWFRFKLRIIFPEEDTNGYQIEFFQENGAESICNQLKQFGIQITDTDFENVSFESLFSFFSENPPKELCENIKNDIYASLQKSRKKNMGELSRGSTLKVGNDLYSVELDENDDLLFKRLQLTHGKYGKFNISEESDGTRRLIQLIDIFLSEDDDVTFVVDEIDRSLHPLITKRFIELFLSSHQDLERQLIVSTHESRLLDLSFLRKDEIWFMTKEDGVSHLQTLESFGVRPDLKIDMAYLKGKLVQIPRW